MSGGFFYAKKSYICKQAGTLSENHGRQCRSGTCRLRIQRGCPLFPHGRAVRQLGCRRQGDNLRNTPAACPDAVRGWCSRHHARSTALRVARHNLHFLTGTAPHDPQPLPYGGRTAAGCSSRCIPCAGDPRSLHLRRSLRHLCLPPDRRCHLGMCRSTGGHGSVACSPPRRPQRQDPLYQLL